MNYETIELKTKRLIIKKGQLEDYLKVYEFDFNNLKNIDGIMRYEKQDLNKIKKLFRGNINKYYEKLKKAHMFDWVIYLDNMAIGNILCQEADNKTIELSFNVHPNYWGQGYMPEALEIVLNYLFSLGYDNLTCVYTDGNLRAKRVLSKLGFKPFNILVDSFESELGNMIDEYKTSLSKDDWFSRTARII